MDAFRRAWLPLAACLLLAAAAAGYVLAADGEKAEGPVLTVDGEAVTAMEFQAAMSRERIGVIQQFQSRYGAEFDQGFWQRRYDGQTPLEVLRQKALEQITKLKVQQIAAKREGIVTDISYDGFLKSREEENRRRQEDAGRGKVIYGPLQFGQEEYYQYTFSLMLTRLQERLAAGELASSPEEIDVFYEKNKNVLYRQTPSIRTRKLFISGSEGEAASLAKQAQAEAQQLQSLAEAAETMNGKVETDVQLFDAQTLRNDARYMPELLEAARRLAPGEISGVVPVAGGYAILQCVERQEGGYASMEQANEDIRSRLMEQKYESWLMDQVRRAKVETHREMLDSMDVQDSGFGG
ncbi:peptidylprolyl isomerase [Paenibacillus dendrobii]|uniref:peptidylprolyl isomerase n=1 Tax=Paenibacillus dendrobii TaxID=2691084 RepID=UPI001371221B|nr:peptidylprolyl isomerase [Paenibacillus dendrobii]